MEKERAEVPCFLLQLKPASEALMDDLFGPPKAQENVSKEVAPQTDAWVPKCRLSPLQLLKAVYHDRRPRGTLWTFA